TEPRARIRRITPENLPKGGRCQVGSGRIDRPPLLPNRQRAEARGTAGRAAPFLLCRRASPGPFVHCRGPQDPGPERREESSMAKQMVFESDAPDAIRRGVEKLAKAVVSTLGPRGRNAVLDKGWGAPTITKDGVTVAEEIQLQDPYEHMGAQLVKEVASKTSDVAGDGTTTATLLTEAIFTQGLRAITAGAAPSRLNQALREGTSAVVAELEKTARKVSKNDEIRQVATISANNDPATGKLIADAMEKVGKDGVITVEDGKTLETDVTVVEGMQFDRGFLSPHFVNDPQKMEVVFEKPLILV